MRLSLTLSHFLLGDTFSHMCPIPEGGSILAAFSSKFAAESYDFHQVFQGIPSYKLDSCFEEKQCRLPLQNVTECDCFSMMNMGHSFMKRSSMTQEEYKQRYRRAAKFHHADKNNGMEQPMIHLNQCLALFTNQDMKQQRKEYIQLCREYWEECGEGTDSEMCFRKKVFNMHGCESKASHKCLLRPGGKRAKRETPRNEKPQSAPTVQERLLLFLDDSGSMQGPKLVKAKVAFQKLMPRVERTPTQIHFIRSDGASTQIFDFKDDFTFEDVADQWKAGYGTYLWHYTQGVLEKVAYYSDLEVIIVTDGCDNQSPPAYQGGEGFNVMMEKLVKQGIRPRFRILYIGTDACQAVQHYRNLALASGGSFAHLPCQLTDEEEGQIMGQFVQQASASHGERMDQAEIAQNKYLELTHSGEAQSYAWSKDLMLPGKKKQVFSTN